MGRQGDRAPHRDGPEILVALGVVGRDLGRPRAREAHQGGLLRRRFGPPHQIESIAVSTKNGYGYRIRYEDKKEPIIGKGSTRQVAKKADYEFTAQWEGKKWKFSVSGTDIDTFDMAEEPKELAFIAAKGGGELLSLAVRKK